MLCCEVSEIADMIIATTLPDHLHFYRIYLFKARITTKEKLLSVKVLKLWENTFSLKNPIWLPVVRVCWLGFKGLINQLIND